jgi:hypothetical protein
VTFTGGGWQQQQALSLPSAVCCWLKVEIANHRRRKLKIYDRGLDLPASPAIAMSSRQSMMAPRPFYFQLYTFIFVAIRNECRLLHAWEMEFGIGVKLRQKYIYTVNF